MNILYVVIGVVVVLLFMLGGNQKKPNKAASSLNEGADSLSADLKNSYKYKKIDRIVSPAERSFLGVLNSVLNDNILLLTKVRVADALTPLGTQDRSLWKKAFNCISSKHFDFVLCRADDLSIICAIELNDKSHNEISRKERDDFLRRACESAGLPLLEFQAKAGYMVQEVLDALNPYISTLPALPEPINCDKCGLPMVLRIKKRGNDAGQQFYGCSGYPSCRHIKDHHTAV